VSAFFMHIEKREHFSEHFTLL